ncbi:MAG: hypothetical protein KKG43_04235, partial [Candidatus Omnitrophica bacterium]|nr:hypothetical protein [Candidatus Omnitrophota bacterium]
LIEAEKIEGINADDIQALKGLITQEKELIGASNEISKNQSRANAIEERESLSKELQAITSKLDSVSGQVEIKWRTLINNGSKEAFRNLVINHALEVVKAEAVQLENARQSLVNEKSLRDTRVNRLEPESFIAYQKLPPEINARANRIHNLIQDITQARLRVKVTKDRVLHKQQQKDLIKDIWTDNISGKRLTVLLKEEIEGLFNDLKDNPQELERISADILSRYKVAQQAVQAPPAENDALNRMSQEARNNHQDQGLINSIDNLKDLTYQAKYLLDQLDTIRKQMSRTLVSDDILGKPVLETNFIETGRKLLAIFGKLEIGRRELVHKLMAQPEFLSKILPDLLGDELKAQLKTLEKEFTVNQKKETVYLSTLILDKLTSIIKDPRMEEDIIELKATISGLELAMANLEIANRLKMNESKQVFSFENQKSLIQFINEAKKVQKEVNRLETKVKSLWDVIFNRLSHETKEYLVNSIRIVTEGGVVIIDKTSGDLIKALPGSKEVIGALAEISKLTLSQQSKIIANNFNYEGEYDGKTVTKKVEFGKEAKELRREFKNLMRWKKQIERAKIVLDDLRKGPPYSHLEWMVSLRPVKYDSNGNLVVEKTNIITGFKTIDLYTYDEDRDDYLISRKDPEYQETTYFDYSKAREGEWPVAIVDDTGKTGETRTVQIGISDSGKPIYKTLDNVVRIFEVKEVGDKRVVKEIDLR